MQKIRTVALLLLLIVSASVNSQTEQDSLKVLQTVNLYNQGWYEGDSAKMSQALHPELVKRIVQNYKDTGNDVISNLSYNLMMQYDIAGYGMLTPKEKQNDTVTILDIYEEIACVKIESFEIVDYLQLARYDGNWKIINVLWTMKAKESK